MFHRERGAVAALFVQLLEGLPLAPNASTARDFDIIILDHVMVNTAFVGNTGHCRNEIDLASSEGLDDMRVVIIKRQKIFPSSPSATA